MEKNSPISCDTDIIVIFADERVITIQKPRTILRYCVYKILQFIIIRVSNKVITFPLAY